MHSTKATDKSSGLLQEKLGEEYLCPQHRLETDVLVSCLTNWGKSTCALNTGYRQEFWSVAGETEGRDLAPSTQATDRSSGLLQETQREENLRPQHRLWTGVLVSCWRNFPDACSHHHSLAVVPTGTRSHTMLFNLMIPSTRQQQHFRGFLALMTEITAAHGETLRQRGLSPYSTFDWVLPEPILKNPFCLLREK